MYSGSEHISSSLTLKQFFYFHCTARRQASTTYSTGHGTNNNSSMSADSNSADYSTVDSPTSLQQTGYDLISKETRESTDMPPPCNFRTQATYITAVNN